MSSLYNPCLSSQCLALRSMLPCSSLDILGRHLLNQDSLVYVFFFFRQVSPVAHIAPITLLWFHVLLRPSSTFPGPSPHFPSLGSDPPHDATVFLGRRNLQLWLLVTRWRHPLSCVLYPTSSLHIILNAFSPGRSPEITVATGKEARDPETCLL